MKQYITLVFEYESDSELKDIRQMATKESCRAWSMDHELARLDMLSSAIEQEDIKTAHSILSKDGCGQ